MQAQTFQKQIKGFNALRYFPHDEFHTPKRRRKRSETDEISARSLRHAQLRIWRENSFDLVPWQINKHFIIILGRRGIAEGGLKRPAPACAWNITNRSPKLNTPKCETGREDGVRANWNWNKFPSKTLQ